MHITVTAKQRKVKATYSCALRNFYFLRKKKSDHLKTLKNNLRKTFEKNGIENWTYGCFSFLHFHFNYIIPIFYKQQGRY